MFSRPAHPSDDGSAEASGAREMIPARPWYGLLALAGVLAIGGCSARTGGGAATAAHHDFGVRLTPEPANAMARIAVVFEDPRLEPAKCRFQWRRNGSLIADAQTDGLDPSHFSKNDQIAVAVSAPDPSSGAVRTLHAAVRVENTPPKLTRVTLAVSTASGTPELQANVECVDPDGDVPTYTYRWLRNDAAMDGAAGPSLPLSRIAPGDRVALEVVARDDASSSSPVRSDAFNIENRPPQFSSQPVAPRAADVSFRYHAVATDPDGDPLRYSLVSGPIGMTVDASGNIYWPLPLGDSHRGAFPVRIRAIDAKGGEATQDFTISLDPPPAKSKA
jgi:hypothetical protein